MLPLIIPIQMKNNLNVINYKTLLNIIKPFVQLKNYLLKNK